MISYQSLLLSTTILNDDTLTWTLFHPQVARTSMAKLPSYIGHLSIGGYKCQPILAWAAQNYHSYS